jgi:hypothetical protein
VWLSWKKYTLPTGTIVLKMLDADDITKQWELTITDGEMYFINYVDSGWEEKDIEICEDGSAVTRTFLVKKLS